MSSAILRRALSTSATARAMPAPPQGNNLSNRLKFIKLYKELHRLGRDYPDEKYEFNKRLRRAFEKNADCNDPEKIEKNLALGEHVKKEVLAMLSLKKYRHLKRAYSTPEPSQAHK